MSAPTSVTVRILDKEYQVACPEEERVALIESADLLNRRMKEIRDTGKVVGLDRIAVMAALNMANELLQIRGSIEEFDDEVSDRARSMRQRMDEVLGAVRQFEF